MSTMKLAPMGRPATIENLESRLLTSSSPMAELALAMGGRGGEAQFNALLHYAQVVDAHVSTHGPVSHPAPVAKPPSVTHPKPVVKPKPVAQPKPAIHVTAPVAKPKPVTTTTHVPPTTGSSPTTVTTSTLHNVPVTPTMLTVQTVTGAKQPAATGPVPWTRDAVLQNIQPMQHSTAGRLPLFAWGLPTGYGVGLIQQSQD